MIIITTITITGITSTHLYEKGILSKWLALSYFFLDPLSVWKELATFT